MSSIYNKRRRELAMREYKRARGITFVSDLNDFDDWFATVFLVDLMYSEMVQNEIGTDDNYVEDVNDTTTDDGSYDDSDDSLSDD